MSAGLNGLLAELECLLGGALFTDIARPAEIIHGNRDIEDSSVSVLYPPQCPGCRETLDGQVVCCQEAP